MNSQRTHFIQGKWLPGTDQLFASINPATQKNIWKGAAATSEEIHLAITSAKKSFKSWSNQDLTTRIYHLQAFRESLKNSKNHLSIAISQETGKPLWESKTEVASMINKIGISIEAYGVRCPEMLKDHNLTKSITRHRPHGVLAVFGPFNFPGHLPNGHIVPALLAGNTVVFKPSELTPLVAELIVECWHASGLPDGVLNLIQGGKETGKLLSQHPDLDGILFTGSWQTGRLLAENYAKNPDKILALEMGGNNPLIVSKISNLRAAAYQTIQSAFLTSGQRCTCARRLILTDDYFGDKFLETLIEMIGSVRIGDYNETPEPFMGPVISVHTAEALLKKQDDLISLGAKPLLKLEKLSKGPAFLSPGLLDVTSQANRIDEEIFGPLLQVIRVNNFEEAIVEANNTQYGLTAGLFSDDETEYSLFYHRVRAGIINWNTSLTGASSSAPFGGIRHSGNNRPSAFYAADYCAYPVASMEAPTLTMPTAIPPGITMKEEI